LTENSCEDTDRAEKCSCKAVQKLFEMDDVILEFEKEAIEAIADKAIERTPVQED